MTKRKRNFDQAPRLLGDKIDDMKRALQGVESLTALEERRLRELYDKALNLCGNLRYTFSMCSNRIDDEIDHYSDQR